MAKTKSNREKPFVTARFIKALGYAARLHASQIRKRTTRPYIGHLLSVTSIVIEYGGDEEMAIAALLHDAVEDQGGLPRLREIRKKFGGRVAHIVDGCTDSYTEPKPPWRERKLAYIERVAAESADVRLVSAADKLSNAREKRSTSCACTAIQYSRNSREKKKALFGITARSWAFFAKPVRTR